MFPKITRNRQTVFPVEPDVENDSGKSLDSQTAIELRRIFERFNGKTQVPQLEGHFLAQDRLVFDNSNHWQRIIEYRLLVQNG